jgi:hypothetical protein
MFFNLKSRVTIQAKAYVKCIYMDRQKFQDMIIPELRLIELNAQAYHAFIPMSSKSPRFGRLIGILQNVND